MNNDYTEKMKEARNALKSSIERAILKGVDQFEDETAVYVVNVSAKYLKNRSILSCGVNIETKQKLP